MPDIVRSDNGPQFSSFEFARFAREWQFSHVTFSPHYAQSNGKMENAVKIAKQLRRKAKELGTDPWLALLTWQNTPAQGFDTSPVQQSISGKKNAYHTANAQAITATTQT